MKNDTEELLLAKHNFILKNNNLSSLEMDILVFCNVKLHLCAYLYKTEKYYEKLPN